MRYLVLCMIVLGMVLFAQRTTASEIATINNTTLTERVNLNTNGSQANQDSDRPDMSADGRYVVFSSGASNLVTGDNNGKQDIFLHDRQTGVTTRISNRTGGEQANGDSFAPAISDDGRIIVYYSLASNLVADDNNGKTDIFAHRRETGQTELISVVIGGSANADSRDPDISADGRYVSFTSSATNLIGGDTNAKDDIFRWDRDAQIMERISVDSNEAEANGHSRSSAISGDGQRITFASEASNLVAADSNNTTDIFMRNTTDGTTIRVSVNSDDNQANGESWEPDISASGDHIVFVSLASNLVGGDVNGYADIFLRNLDTGRTRLVSIATNGTQGNDWAEEPSVSGDGRYVTFQSYASNLVSGDVSDTRDVFIRDRHSDTLIRASNSSPTTGGDGSSKEPVLASNGRFVIYSSKATDLIVGDTNDKRDIFVSDYFGAPTLEINHTTGAPGSTFIVTGERWNANQAVAVSINGVALGNVTTDSEGDIEFQLLTTAGTQQGVYGVTAVQADFSADVAFTLTATAPLRPGSGGGFNVPDNIALTEFVYLPLVVR